jgi:hypothetical protein
LSLVSAKPPCCCSTFSAFKDYTSKEGSEWHFGFEHLIFTPYNPENPSLQTGDGGNFKCKDKEKPRPLGWGYTGFTSWEEIKCD